MGSEPVDKLNRNGGPYWVLGLSLLVILGGLWLPRAFQLDHFVTSDESRWLIRSGNFYHALSTGELENTFQHGHPGVTVMWAGMLGYWWAYPEYVDETPGQFGWKDDLYEGFIEEQGYDPLELLAAGRLMIVLANVLILGAAFLVWVRTVDIEAAAIGFLLLGLDPFEIGFARFLHPDGLLYSLMILAVVGSIGFYNRSAKALRTSSTDRSRRPWGLLVLSGIAAGMAWLTKTPGLFLMPFCGLMILVAEIEDAFRGDAPKRIPLSPQANLRKTIRQVANTFGVWLLAGVTTFILGWPAMWVAPVATLEKVFDISAGYAIGGHDNPIFFQSQSFYGDPGYIFYPLTVMWRTTPIIWIGFALALFLMVNRLFTRKPRSDSISRLIFLLVSYVLLFTLFMSVGAKKFDRYLLPVYPALALVAGLGWVRSGQLIRHMAANTRFAYRLSPVFMIAVGLLIFAQGLFSLPHFPYYISYYNPWLGGGEAAKSVLSIGWGEGTNAAARYLNQRQSEDATALTVASWHERSPFSYFFDGESIPLEYFWAADYALTYVGQQQRQLPSRQLSTYFARQEPIERIILSGTPYADIFHAADLAQSPFGVTWQDDGQDIIKLVSYTLFSGTVQPGSEQDLILHLVNVGAIDKNLNILVRVIDQDENELLRADQWPFGAATKNWGIGELWLDKHMINIPTDAKPGLYRVEVSFYDPDSLNRLHAVANDGRRGLGDTVVLDYLIVGDRLANRVKGPSFEPIEPAATIGGFVKLVGYDLSTGVESTADQQIVTSRAGERIHIGLHWQALSYGDSDYTTFVHLVSPDGLLAAQQDRPPLSGFVPTTLWSSGLMVQDRYWLDLPDNLVDGEYQVTIGLYDPVTQSRLPITVDGQESSPNSLQLDALRITSISISSR